MEKYLPVLKKSQLFTGVSEKELLAMIRCLDATKESYGRNQFILRVGDDVKALGLVVAGKAHVIKEDFWGNRNIMAQAGPGELFAEVYACTPRQTLGASVVAGEATTVIFLDLRRTLTTCTSACEFHTRLIRNLLTVLAERNLGLEQKLTHMAQRSTREKLLSYLSAQAQDKASSTFEIPFNRQQLADYLSVDRSAMSSELGKMRDEGLLTFAKNSFTLMTPLAEQ